MPLNNCRETSETSTEPNKSPRTFPITLQDLIDSLEHYEDKDRMVEIFLDSPEDDEIFRVKFAHVDETEQ